MADAEHEEPYLENDQYSSDESFKTNTSDSEVEKSKKRTMRREKEKVMIYLSSGQKNSMMRCPVCVGDGSITKLKKGIDLIMRHARTTKVRRIKLHRKLAREIEDTIEEFFCRK